MANKKKKSFYEQALEADEKTRALANVAARRSKTRTDRTIKIDNTDFSKNKDFNRLAKLGASKNNFRTGNRLNDVVSYAEQSEQNFGKNFVNQGSKNISETDLRKLDYLNGLRAEGKIKKQVVKDFEDQLEYKGQQAFEDQRKIDENINAAGASYYPKALMRGIESGVEGAVNTIQRATGNIAPSVQRAEEKAFQEEAEKATGARKFVGRGLYSIGQMLPAVATGRGAVNIAESILAKDAATLGANALKVVNRGKQMTPAMQGAIIGNSTMWAGIAGNDYAQLRREGKSDLEALSYSILDAGLETAMTYGLGKFMGGIKGLTPTTTTKFKDAVGRLSINPKMQKTLKLLADMNAEGTEEFIQLVLNPVIKNMSIDGSYEQMDLTPEGGFETYAMAFLTAGVFNAASYFSGASNNPTQAVIDYKLQDGTTLSAKTVNKYFEGKYLTLEEHEEVKNFESKMTEEDIDNILAQVVELSQAKVGESEKTISQIKIETEHMKPSEKLDYYIKNTKLNPTKSIQEKYGIIEEAGNGTEQQDAGSEIIGNTQQEEGTAAAITEEQQPETESSEEIEQKINEKDASDFADNIISDNEIPETAKEKVKQAIAEKVKQYETTVHNETDEEIYEEILNDVRQEIYFKVMSEGGDKASMVNSVMVYLRENGYEEAETLDRLVKIAKSNNLTKENQTYISETIKETIEDIRSAVIEGTENNESNAQIKKNIKNIIQDAASNIGVKVNDDKPLPSLERVKYSDDNAYTNLQKQYEFYANSGNKLKAKQTQGRIGEYERLQNLPYKGFYFSGESYVLYDVERMTITLNIEKFENRYDGRKDKGYANGRGKALTQTDRVRYDGWRNTVDFIAKKMRMRKMGKHVYETELTEANIKRLETELGNISNISYEKDEKQKITDNFSELKNQYTPEIKPQEKQIKPKQFKVKPSTPLNEIRVPTATTQAIQERNNNLEAVREKKVEREQKESSLFTNSVPKTSLISTEGKKIIEQVAKKEYGVWHNSEQLQTASNRLKENGEGELMRFMNLDAKEATAADVAEGIILIDYFNRTKDYESMVNIVEKLRTFGTKAGQTVQAFSLLARMSPEGMLYYAQKSLKNAQEAIAKNQPKDWIIKNEEAFKLTKEDTQYIVKRMELVTKLPEGRDKYILLGEIAARVQNKIPPTKGQGIKAYTRISMLLNPKTNIRNVLGNVLVVPINGFADTFIGQHIDKAVSAKSGTRTTGTFHLTDFVTGAKKGIFETFDDFTKHINTKYNWGDRYEFGEGFGGAHVKNFSDKTKMGRVLNALDSWTGYALETGDRPAYEGWFLNSINNQIALNKVTTPTPEMVEVATLEALQRTWQDTNAATKAAKQIQKTFNMIGTKDGEFGLGNMLVAFTKTPANLAKAIFDYSPAAMVKVLTRDAQNLNYAISKGENVAVMQKKFVDGLSKSITGTLIMLIGGILTASGIMSGGGDEDKDVANFEKNVLGIQPYSFKIGNKTISYDWAQPIGSLLSISADVVKGDTKANAVQTILNAVSTGGGVLFEQSFLQGIQNLFKDGDIVQGLINVASGSATQFSPSIINQFAQLIDRTNRSTYEYKNPLKTTANRLIARTPVASKTLGANYDVLGNELENAEGMNIFFNPAITKTNEHANAAANELWRVYQQTGESGIIPRVAPYYATDKNGEKVILTSKERSAYQKFTGQNISKAVNSIINNADYNKMSDINKSKVLSEIVS
jgi:hypothetical protein